MTEAAPNGTTFLVSGPASTVSGYAKAIVAGSLQWISPPSRSAGHPGVRT